MLAIFVCSGGSNVTPVRGEGGTKKGKIRREGIEAGVLIAAVGLGGQQELNAEITEEIGLIAAGGFEAASGHEEKDHRAMDFVAPAEIDSGLALRKDGKFLGNRTPCPLRVLE